MPEYVKVIGNIKYATQTAMTPELMNISKPYVLLASSRDKEEKLIAQTWLSMKEDKPLLVIVPRHIQRLSEILDDLKGLSNKIAVRSRQEPVNENTEIYIADTFGELSGFIHGSQFVIMGGSFEPFGGQNIIEVGQAGKAVIFGPHMNNFQMEAEQFLQADAAIQVMNQKSLTTILQDYFSNPEKIKSMGGNGLELIKQHEHIIDDYMTELQKFCPLINS